MTTQLLERTTTPIDEFGDTQATQHNPVSSRTIDACSRHIALILLQYATTPLLSMLWLGATASALLGPASWLQTAAMTVVAPCNEEPATGTDDDDEDFIITVPEGWEDDGDDGSELVFPTLPLEEGLAILSGTETQSGA